MSEAVQAPLSEIIKQQIRLDGPINVAEYMSLALYHPSHGYYVQGRPLGADGDFITAPEISQIFGELIGLWTVQSWYEMGAPDTLHLIELGPGRGTLMKDALRAARMRPDFMTAVHVHLVESNIHLRAQQREALQEIAAPTWHDDLTHIPNGPTLVIANEFFDCLPIRQFMLTERGWCERKIGLDDAEAFTFLLHPTPLLDIAPLGPAAKTASEGDIIETCASADSMIETIAARLSAHAGRALILDYGYAQPGTGDTLQALKRHHYTDALKNPGQVDLTAHVNFAALADRAGEHGMQVQGPIDQGAFLKALGIDVRAEALAKAATPSQQQNITQAVTRLCDAAQMGTLFQVLEISSPSLPPATGF